MPLGLFDAYVIVQTNREVCVCVCLHALVHILGGTVYKSSGGGVEHGDIGLQIHHSTIQAGIYVLLILNI